MPAKSRQQKQAALTALKAKQGDGCGSLEDGSAKQMCEEMSVEELEKFAYVDDSAKKNTSNTQKSRNNKVLYRD